MVAPGFSSIGLAETLLEGLAALGLSVMTDVQQQALPGILGGEDLVVEAEPGSGKTVAFGLGMLASVLPHLPPAAAQVRALGVCPTRELAEQVAGEVRKLARRTPNVKVLVLCGGVPFAPQRASLKQGAHVVIGTPGRLEEHLRKGSLSLEALELLVLDEADRIMSMGFAEQLAAVVRHAPAERQTLLFSATIPDSIALLSRTYQRQARRITVVSSGLHQPPAGEPSAGAAPHGDTSPVGAEVGVALRSAASSSAGSSSAASPSAGSSSAASPSFATIEQRFYRVSAKRRLHELGRWLLLERPSSALVFCNTRAECAEVANELGRQGWVAAAIHGEMSQRERTHVMRLFAAGSCSVLAATDVAARGWDIGGLAAVVNLGLASDRDVHLHRVGRTGRAGQAGLAVHFVAEQDLNHLADIERTFGFSAELLSLPAAPSESTPAPPPMVTLLLSAGKNKKLRPGDILGALTAAGGVRGEDVGAIHIDESSAYVAVRAEAAELAMGILRAAPVKGRSIKVRRAGVSLRDEP